MSPELTEVTEMIDEQFEIEAIELDDEDFWQSLVNLFIWFKLKAESKKTKAFLYTRALCSGLSAFRS